MSQATYHAIERSLGLALDLFYRRVHLRGELPAEGPVIVVANHPNALIDPAVVARLAPRPVRFLGKEPLFRMPGVSWLVKGVGALPVYRAKDGADTSQNDQTFAAVYDALAEGDLICLFPEGIGHNEPRLQPLKTGAARMALGAEARAGWRLGVKVVPVGLTYADKPAFRSDCHTEVGEAIDARDFREAFEEDEQAAARALTDAIRARLAAVTLNLERWEDLPLVELAEMLWRPDGDQHAERPARLKALAAGGQRLAEQDPAALEAVKEGLDSLRRRLDEAGLGPEHLSQRYTPSVLLWFLLRHTVAVALGLPAVVAGTLAYGLPFGSLKLLPRLLRTPPDLMATIRVLGGLIIFPLWHALLAAALVWQLPTTVGVLLSVALPFCGLYAHAFFRRRRRMLRDAGAFLRLLFRPGLRRELLGAQKELAREIDALADELAEAEHVQSVPSSAA